MTRREQIPKHNPERGVPALFNTALAARKILQRAWDETTAYQGIILTPDDVPSRGQCGVSSVWASRQLMEHGVNAKLTEGKIHLGNGTDDHVWIEAHDVADSPLIVDLTSDQYQHILGTAVHVGHYDTDDMPVIYQPLEYFEPYDIPRKKLMARYALLEANIARLPRRFRSL